MSPDLWKMWVPSPSGVPRGNPCIWYFWRSGTSPPPAHHGGKEGGGSQEPGCLFCERACSARPQARHVLPGFLATLVRVGGTSALLLPQSWRRKGRAQLPPAGRSRTSNVQAVTVADSSSTHNCQPCGAGKAADHRTRNLLLKIEVLTQARPAFRSRWHWVICLPSLKCGADLDKVPGGSQML